MSHVFLATFSPSRYPLSTHSWLSTLKHFLLLALLSGCSWLFAVSNALIPTTPSQPVRAFTTSITRWVIADLLWIHPALRIIRPAFICHKCSLNFSPVMSQRINVMPRIVRIYRRNHWSHLTFVIIEPTHVLYIGNKVCTGFIIIAPIVLLCSLTLWRIG